MKGKRRKAGFTNAFLEAEGAAHRSTMAMTENAFMTDAAWEEIADDIVRGYRLLLVVQDNPQ